MDKSEKANVVSHLHEELKKAVLVVRFGFIGLKVEQINTLRREMQKVVGTEMAVIKNTLAEIASRETDTAPLFKTLAGPNAFLIVKGDIVEPVKILETYAKKNQKLVLLDGVLQGRYLTPEKVRSLSSMPSRPELLGRLLYVLEGPKTMFVRTLAEVPRGLLNVLNAYKAEKEKTAA